MAGATIKTVHAIFQSMEYGPAATCSTATAQAWLDNHSRSLGLFIDGKFVHPSDRQTRSLMDSKGGLVCSTVCATQADISYCVTSAIKGFEAWSGLSCYQRSQMLQRLASALGQHGRSFSELCDLCRVSCSSATLVRMLQYYSSWAQLRDTLIANWMPLGVVLVVVSDDCSLYSLMLKVLPALAMGNSVILVPGQSTAPAALLLAQLFVGARLPAGALSVLTGSDMSMAADVAQNASISYVTYSGSKEDGVKLCKATAGMGVPVSVTQNIGTTCPIIIFESADINSAVDDVLETAFKKNKEVHWVLCVQESVLDSVMARLRLRMAGLKCVALPSDGARVLVDTAVQDAQNKGAMLLQSCAVPSGTRYPPTVLCGAAPSSPCVVTPSPGPLLPLMTFRSNTEAVTLGNHSPHGQAACVWTEDLTLALETSKSLSVGSVWVNSHPLSDPCLPVSGHKDSGTCTDGGQEGLYQFLRPSSTCVLPRATPVALDYAKFGTDATPFIIPDETVGTVKSFAQFIAGKACKSECGASVVVRSQGGGSVLGYCPDGGQKDVRNAVEAAIKVQPGWMKKCPSARAQSIQSLAKGLEGKRQDIAKAISSQTGIPMEEAEVEVELSIARLRDWAAYCDKVHGGTLPVPQSGSGLSVPEALGVVGVVLPDKHPLLSMATLLGAALASGNAIIAVPSQEYPLPALAFIQVLLSSDLPAGLVNIITGRRDKLTKALANHSVIKAIWYWGNSEGCQYLQYTCTKPLKTLHLFCQTDKDGNHGSRDWTHASVLEEMWRNAVQWKSVWIPTA
ncbi:aldehyde dehydrogenase family 16 member A1 isoform X1 [Phyllopteryx taeniolatus]|uniref:aldehyde dehydrogenase family 16 member A1 isoform X1 n=1 Tax=Phyllopteryx taeniolatus TaxID=161469 RepID=UPI002AD44530|nr:aldehyde dehydrogenase family 16 member A1 isoform X1 [Phyllopteryx taeniolatus]